MTALCITVPPNLYLEFYLYVLLVLVVVMVLSPGRRLRFRRGIVTVVGFVLGHGLGLVFVLGRDGDRRHSARYV